MKFRFSLIAAAAIMILCAFNLHAQSEGDFRSNVTTGNWNVTGSWQRFVSGSWVAATVLPGATANNGNVTIQNGHTISVTAAPTAAISSITVGGGTSGVLSLGGFAISVTGLTTIQTGGTVNITSATGTKTFTGGVLNDGTWNNSGNSAITITGNITNNGTWNSGTGLYTLNSNGVRVISGTISFGGSVSCTVAGASYTNNGTMSVTGTMTVSSGSGSFTNAGTFSAATVAVTAAGGVFNNGSSATVTTAITGAGSFVNQTNATLQFAGATVAITTFNATAGGNTVVYNNAGTAQTVRGTTYFHLTISKNSGVAATLGAGTTVSGDLTVSSGVLADGGFVLTGNATGNWTMAAGAVYRTTRGNTSPWLPTNFVNANINLDPTSEIDFGSTLAINFTATAFDQINNTFPCLRISGAGTKLLASAITIERNLTLTAGALDDGGNQITGNALGTVTMTGTSTLFLGSTTVATVFPTNYVKANISLAATSVVNYKSNQAQLISNVPDYGSLHTSSTAAVNKTLEGNTLITGTLTNATNNTLQLGSFDVTIQGGTTPITNNGTIAAASTGSANVILSGSAVMSNLTNAGTLSPRFNLIIQNTNVAGVTLGGSNVSVHDFTIDAAGRLNLGSQTIRISGAFANNGVINAPTNTGRLYFDGSAAQSFNPGTLLTGVLSGLTIDNAAGVTLDAPLTVGVGTAGTNNLQLLNGLLNTTTTNVLTLNTLASVGGGSNTSYVNGPVRRIYGSGTTAAAGIVPIGDNGVYTPVNLTAVTTTAVTTVEFAVVPSQLAGTLFTGLSALNPNRHWSLNAVGTNSITGYTLAITETGSTFNSESRIVRNDSGLITPYTSTGASATLTASAGVFGGTLGLFSNAQGSPIASGTYTVGPGGDYEKLYQVALALNGFGVAGPVIFEMLSTYDGTTGEIFPIVFNQATGVSSVNTVTIRPASGAANLQTTGSLNGALIDLGGADWITFDGRPGGTGTAREWTFDNTFYALSASPNTFRYINGATNNALTYLNVRGSGSGAQPNINAGAIHFGTSSSGGNSNNTVSFCSVAPGTGGQLSVAITSSGSASNLNSAITITDNAIYDFHENAAKQSGGIAVDVNNGAWTITNNSFYQTSARNFPSGFGSTVISLSSGTGHNVSNNFIGGSTVQCGGAPWSSTGPSGAYFRGILFGSSTAGTPASTIGGNTIANFNWATGSGVALPGASWTAVQYSPASSGNQVSISNNTIGSTTQNGNIVIDISANASEIRSTGIIVSQATSGGSPTISGNTIAGIRTTSSSAGQPGHSFAGIYVGTGAWTVTNNTIGSELAHSISTDFTMPLNNSTQTLWGIYSGNASGTTTISNNTIRNLTNYSISTTTGSTVIGINVETGLNNIIGNTIYSLTAHSRSAATFASAPLMGVRMISTFTGGQAIRGNTIYDLNAVTTSAVALQAYGVFYTGPTAGTNRIEQNIIHSISNDATGAGALCHGIYVASGSFPLTIQNNMIRMGIRSDGTTHPGNAEHIGIALQSTTTVPVIYNSIYVGGTGVSGSANSFAFRRISTSGTHAVRNNIFENARSNGSGTGTHYAAGYAGLTGVTADYNLLSASGTGGAVGLNAATTHTGFCAWVGATNQDLNSIDASGSFINPTGNATSVNLKLQNTNAAESRAENTGITAPTVDQEGDARSGQMDIGADEGNYTFSGTELSGTVTVGTGGDYETLTGACGLFSVINNSTLTGNLVAQVISDITEPGIYALNQWTESGAGNYTLTIQSDGTARTITANYTGAAQASSGFIRFNGADRVTISGGTGVQRLLTFRNTNNGANASVIHYLNDASDNQINNCNLEGALNNNATAGIVLVGTGAVTGNDNIIITNNTIRDRSDINAVDRPNSGVTSAGSSASIVNNTVQVTNNTFDNIYRAGTRASAIALGTGSQGWTISGNTFLMTAPPTATASTENWVIYLNSATLGGHVVDNNLIENWTVGGAVTYRFVGIFNQTTGVASVTGVTITNNTIRNMTVTSSTGGAANYGVFSGIYFASGYGTVTGNTIGSLTQNDNIVVSSSSNGGQAYAIRSISTAPTLAGNSATVFSNNTIGGIRGTGVGSAVGFLVEAISTTAGSITFDSNTIGGATDGAVRATNTVSNSSGATRVYGIVSTASASYQNVITNNIIRNLESTNSSTNGSVNGIRCTGGSLYTINNNTLHTLISAGSTNAAGIDAVVVGIGLSSANSGGFQIVGNTVYNLLCNTIASTPNSVIGIVYAGSTGTIAGNQVARNVIHSLNNTTDETIAPYGQMYGVLVASGAGVVTVANNMIRLGLDMDGNSITRSLAIAGIGKQSATQANVYHNTVYIAGDVAATNPARTAAFWRTTTSASDRIQNNIFVNERSTNTTGVIRHYATILNTTSLAAMNNNLYRSSGVLGNLFSNDGGTTGINTLQAMQAAISGQNTASAVVTMAQINFISATGPGSTLNLRLNAATAAAGNGANGTGVTTDIDGIVTRPSPPAIGAHEGTFDPLGPDTDIFPPVISVASVPVINAACGANQTVTITATVSDAVSGVATGSLAPQLWWRLSTGTWANLAPAVVAGNTYTYQLNLSGIIGGQVYQYYVAAQDAATTPNIAYSHFNASSPVHADVATFPSTANGAPASFTISSVVPLPSVVIVGGSPGAGETTGVNHFTSFSRFDGFFREVFDQGLSGDVTVLVRANVTNEDGNFSLNNWTEYCGSGYTITIRPETASLKTLSGSLLGMGLFTINASRVTIDGRLNGEGTDRYLRFENTYSGTGGSENNTFRIGVSGQNNVNIRYCEIVGQSTKVAGGVILLAQANGVTLENNLIRGGTAYAVNAIRADGSNNITISNNEIFNFFSWNSGERARGIFVTSTLGGGNNWNISGNSVYNTFINGTSANTAISFTPGTGGNGSVISGNFIGGSAAQCGGADFFRNNTLSDFIMLEVNCGSTTPTVISNNTIRRVHAQNGDAGGVTCIMVRGSSRVEITGNTIGDAVLVNEILSNGGGVTLSSNTGWVYGIDAQTSSPILIDNNLIGGLAAVGSFRSFGNSIELWGSGTATVTDNTIVNSYHGANESDYNYFGIAFTNTGNANHIVRGNTIRALGSSSSSGLLGNINCGIIFNGNNQGGVIERNNLSDFFNNSNGGESHGVLLAGSNANFTVSNNMINMINRNWLTEYTTRKIMSGIYDWTTTGTVNVHYNTVVVQGSQTGTAAFDYPSACYYRLPNGSGTVSGSNTNLRNNVFINTRTGAPTVNSLHYAIDNTGNSPSTGWNSNYNFLFNLQPANLGWWGASGGNRTFATWQSSSGGDANSYTATSSGSSNFGSGLLNAAGLFVNISNDLHVSAVDGQSYLFLEDRGITVGTTSIDIDGDTRNATTPDLGADEFTACDAPFITQQPQTPATLCEGSGVATISVTASGAGLTYQWRRNGTPLTNGAPYSGVDTPTLTITNPALAVQGTFDVVITGSCGSPVTSSGVVLTIDPLLTWYLDSDSDGFAVSTTQSCTSPGVGYTLTVLPLTDCNDSDAAINPNTVWYLDFDGDNFAVSTTQSCTSPGAGYTLTVLPLTDCNDNDAAINPNTVWYLDADNDGYAVSSQQSCTSPGAGYVPTVLPLNDCDDNNAAINPGTVWYQDADFDGWSSGNTLLSCTQPVGYYLAVQLAGLTDCNDNNADINPGADEWCNGLDDNCDGIIDEGLPGGTYYIDTDGDGFGAGAPFTACTQPPGYVANNLDCNNNNANIYPGAPELCNGVDDDCDGITDEGCGPANDFIETAALLPNSAIGVCTWINGTLTGAQADPQPGATVITGEDVWYYFSPLTAAVSIECATTSSDVVLELRDFFGALVNTENVVSGIGTERLNFGGLTVGDTYFVRVRNFNSALGTGAFSLCLRPLRPTTCNLTPGNYSLCGTFKSVHTGANQYDFAFDPAGPAPAVFGSTTSGITTLQLGSVPGLLYNTTYSVSINAVYNLTDGAGAPEVFVVTPVVAPCTMVTAAHPDPDLRASDASPNVRFKNSIIGANIWVCGATSMEFEFTQQTPLTGLPFTVNNNTPTRLINLFPIAGIVPGATYLVRIRPMFGAVGGDWGPDSQTLIIAGPASMTAEEDAAFAFESAEGIQANLFPNPTQGDRINLAVDGAEGNLVIRIYDALGREVWNGNRVSEGSLRTTLEMGQTLEGGVYELVILVGEERVTKRFVVTE
jgi:hypothetical protein